MEILMFPFWMLERLMGLFREKRPTRVVYGQTHASPKRSCTAAKPRPATVKKDRDSRNKTLSLTTEPQKPLQGTLYKGVVQDYGTATCESSDGRTYRSFVVHLKDRDGTEQEIRGVDLQQLVDEGKIVKDRFVKILSSRKYASGAHGRRVWKNVFSIV